MGRQDAEWDGIILEALFERAEEGMTIFELRNQIEADIDTIESSLERLKDRGLIETERNENRVNIRPTDAALSMIVEDEQEPSFLEQIRERLPF